jgi:hypothetical protein
MEVGKFKIVSGHSRMKAKRRLRPLHSALFFYNGQQIVLALDENSQDWVTYDEKCLLDTFVIVWKVLESRKELEKQLGLSKFDCCDCLIEDSFEACTIFIYFKRKYQLKNYSKRSTL